MKRFITMLLVAIMIVTMVGVLSGCVESGSADTRIVQQTKDAKNTASNIVQNQPAPTDLSYSLERYNLIRRAYWVNGQREKANALVCEIEKPLGYIVLFSDNGSVIGRFVVDGKVSSLGSYLFPSFVDVDRYSNQAGDLSASNYSDSIFTVELPGIDGGYGSNVIGVFFFTVDGRYIEWTGDFLYSDIPFTVDDPILHYDAAGE